jgi:hypothetical protein
VSASLAGAVESSLLCSTSSLVVVNVEFWSEVDVSSDESSVAEVVVDDVGCVESVSDEVVALDADELVTLDAGEVFDVEDAGPVVFEVELSLLDVVCGIELVLVLPGLLDVFGDVPPLEHAPSKPVTSNVARYRRKFASADDGPRTKPLTCWNTSIRFYVVRWSRQRGGTILTPCARVWRATSLPWARAAPSTAGAQWGAIVGG